MLKVQDLRPLCSLSCKRVAALAIMADMIVTIAGIEVVKRARGQDQNPQHEGQRQQDQGQ